MTGNASATSDVLLGKYNKLSETWKIAYKQNNHDGIVYSATKRGKKYLTVAINFLKQKHARWNLQFVRNRDFQLISLLLLLLNFFTRLKL